MDQKQLTVGELEKLLNISKYHIRLLISQGLITATRTEGGHVRVTIDEYKRFDHLLKKYRRYGLLDHLDKKPVVPRGKYKPRTPKPVSPPEPSLKEDAYPVSESNE